jgi:hypothetical protein
MPWASAPATRRPRRCPPKLMLYPFLRTIAIALAMALLGWLAYWQLSPAPAPPLSKHQEATLRASVATGQRAAAQHEAQATRADTAAQQFYLSGQAIARMAQEYHRQTYPNHAPLPATPSAAALDSLQRILSAY